MVSFHLVGRVVATFATVMDPFRFTLRHLTVISAATLVALCGCTWPTPIPPPVSTQTPAPISFTSGSKVLTIAPIAQQTPEWCWLASAEMIFRYYNVPAVNGISYQCGVMGAVLGPASPCFYNCAQCVFGSGSDSASARVLHDYPAILQQYYFPPQVRVPQIQSTLFERALSPAEVQQQINSGNPVELGVTVGGPFVGQAGHDVVLIGYTAAPTSFAVIIDDPFPYDIVVGQQQNPYYAIGASSIQPGQYLVDYNAAIRGLQWSASITVSAH